MYTTNNSQKLLKPAVILLLKKKHDVCPTTELRVKFHSNGKEEDLLHSAREHYPFPVVMKTLTAVFLFVLNARCSCFHNVSFGIIPETRRNMKPTKYKARLQSSEWCRIRSFFLSTKYLICVLCINSKYNICFRRL